MRLLLLSFLTVFVSCNHTSQPAGVTPVAASVPIKAEEENFKTGEVISSVPLSSDASQSFALYLPASYSDSVRFPVIIFFDPHGDGTVPLNLYHQLADEFHFILVGSNSSKNGMDFRQTKMVADNLVTEVKTRFSVDEEKVAFCGFSGGAKVALLSAAENKSVSSVIYCGAAVSVTPTHPLSFLGFAGNHDMNYTEVVSFGWDLMSSSAKYLIEWSGKHEFPDAKTFKDAFIFLTTGTVPDYESKMVSISVKKLVEEQNRKMELIKAFKTQDINWWRTEINLMNTKKKSDAMYERLLGFISLACYSYAGQSLQQNNLPLAEKILAIYQLSDPGNKDCANFLTELSRRKSGK